MQDEGFLLIATGKDYIEEAVTTAKSIQRHSEKPVALVSDRSVNAECFNEVIVDENPTHSLFDKPRNMGKTPFDKTIFVDTDVYVTSPVPELFKVLEKVDIATTIDPNEYGGRLAKDSHFDDIPESVPIFQTGVICYSSTASVERLFDTWVDIHQEKVETLLTDQSSFRLALYQENVNHLALSDLYNCLGTWPMQVTGEVKIIHKKPVDYMDADRLASRMNTTDSSRLFFTPQYGSIHTPIYPQLNRYVMPVLNALFYAFFLTSRFYVSYREHGLTETLWRSVRWLQS